MGSSNYLKIFWDNIKETLLAFLLAFAFYKGLGLALGTPYPMMVVVSCSMLPTLHRGDVIVVKGVSWDNIIANNQWKDPNSTIIVYYSPLEGKMIVHRAYKKVEKNGDKYLIAWGDNNPQPDPWLVPESNIVGKVIYHIPYLGYPRIWIGELLGEDVGGCGGTVRVRLG